MKGFAAVQRGVLIGAAAAWAFALTVGPAVAQDDDGQRNRLELSNNGTDFTSTLPQGVFSDPPLLVPGESAKDTLWARNSSGESAVISVYAVDSTSTLPANVSEADDFQVSVSAQGAARTTTPLASLDPCVALTSATVGPGEEAKIALRVGLPLSSGNISQRQSVSMDFVVDLRAAEGGGQRCGSSPEPSEPGGPADPGMAPTPGSGSTGGPSLDSLPRTGSDVMVLLSLGLLALLAGGALRRAGRAPSPAAQIS